MKIARWILYAAMLLSVAMHAKADEITGLNKGMTYREVKTKHELFLQENPTREQRLEYMRSIVKTSRYGERGSNNLFRNFEANHSIDPRIPGVEKSVRLLMSGSKSQAKGYVRELVYAVGYHNNPLFTLVEMNRQLGNTDADLVIRDNSTGLHARVEVKDISRDSQRTNIQKYKAQIDKMAAHGRRTGQLQFWVNAREVIPEIEQYARSKGVPVYANISTSVSPKANRVSLMEVMKYNARHFDKAARNRSILGGAGLAFGALTLMDSVPLAWDDIQAISNSASQTNQAWLRLGEHGSYTLVGGGMALSGGALTASTYASEMRQNRLYSLGKIGGIISVVALGLGEGFQIWRYRNGDVFSREFWTSQYAFGATVIGTLGGGWIGGLAGSVVPIPGAGTVGATLGSIAGSMGGGYLGQTYAGSYYDWKFAVLDQKFGEYVYRRYCVQ